MLTRPHQCNALVQLLGDRRVVLPGSEAYESSVQSYFSLKNSETRPFCIVVARSSSEVSAAVRSLSRGRELGKDSCRFAIRSGGHTPFKGAASIDDGVLLDLRRLDAPGVSEDRRSIVASPGWTWDQVTERLDP